MYASGESPWLCQKEVSLILRFAVGHKQCQVNLTIAKGSIVQEICQRLFNEENIPVYLQANIMDAVLRTVNEASMSVVSLSEDVLDVGLMIEQARLLSRQFDVTTTVSQELENAFVTSYGAVDITWSLKPNPNFAAELGRNSASPQRSSSNSSLPMTGPSKTDSASNDHLDAQRLINSSVARGARTPQQSMQLAKMYHFLVAGDQSVTPSSGNADLQSSSTSSIASGGSLIDGDYGFGGSSGGPVLEPTIVKHATNTASSPADSTPKKAGERQLYRTKKQAGGAELLLLQDTTNEFRDMIAELEKSLGQSMAQLTQAKETAIAALGEKQAREMDRASTSGHVERIPQLVEKHMSEMEGLEAKWQVELLEARKRQRREYYAFCGDLYKNRERYLEDKRAMGPQKVSALVRQQVADAAKPSALSAYGWTSLIFGKAANTASGNAEKVIRIESHNSSLKMARETTHDHGTYSIVVMLGSQLKVPFEVQVYGGGGMLSQGNIGNVAKLTPTAASQHVQLSHGDNTSDSIYSSNLTAMVLITDPSMACDSPTYSDFFALASLSTELHFESAHDQIEMVRSQVLPPVDDTSVPGTGSRTTAPPQKLQPGDFFVTTHSNMGKVQVVFHMVGERQNMENSWPQLLAGLKNIMTVASHYDITTLSIPTLLVEPEFRHLYSDGQGIKRAEEVVRCIRSFLVLNSASGISLKVIRLVCPPAQNIQSVQDNSDALYFDKVKNVVSTLFNQALH